ncbi:tail fiber protein [Leifsonia sp. NPDC080035]|uniref:Tail fiber protein n=1 Tax=Leifsonia sp. NPDC080035 TaxID=3143936 RepID=A0AAU7GGA1_9MICO
MGTPFLGEIRVVAFAYAPRGWAFCAGQLLPISQNQALFALLGTTYGGDGVTTFQLPDLRGRVPVHTGNGHTLGEVGGEEAHTLTVAELPRHNHGMSVAASATVMTPSGAAVLAQPGKAAYAPAASTTLSPLTVAPTGGGLPHENMAPYLALTYVIALQGVFPSRN